jgi:hypothetical protein
MAPAPGDGDRDPAARAVRALERGAATLGVQVARSLYGRWRRLPASRRQRLEQLAENVKARALDLRGEPDPRSAGRELRDAGEQLADALVASARADPEVSDIEVRDLRAELARELERLADGEIRASRGPGKAAGGASAGGR